MQLTDEVKWNVADFAVAGALLLAVGVPLELAVRKTSDSAYRAAVAVALVAAFLLIWVSLAVGLIGSENNDANLAYGGVIAVGLIGAIIARFRPRPMARVLFATAVLQALVAVVVMVAGLGSPESGPLEIMVVNGFFVAMFIGSAILFRKAAGRTDV
jgi:hypothetical protein